MAISQPAGRVFNLRTQIIALITSLLLSSLALAALAEEKSVSAGEAAKSSSPAGPQVSAAFGEIEALVKEYYPKAKIVRTEDSLHFEYKARGLTGTQSGLKELSPDSGGVAGDILVKPGRYSGRERNPSETNLILHMVFFTAPYSEPSDHHLFTRLSYPPDASIDFLSRFKTIINDQKKGTQETAAKPVAAPPNTTPPVSQSPVTPPASSAVASADPVSQAPTATAAAAQKPPESAPSKELPKVSFGSRKLSKYSYPEGRFKILLPGNPNCRYSNTLGMRSVDYSYPESHGAFMVSYLIAPGMIVDSKINALLDAVCSNLSKTTKSVELRRNSLTLQGFQGRQVELVPKEAKEGKDAKEQLARFRLYVVRRFVYIIGAAGNKAWVDSPVVAEYLNSLEVVPELTASEARAASEKAYARKREEDKKAFDERMAKSKLDFQEASSRARKDFERSQADFKFRRF